MKNTKDFYNKTAEEWALKWYSDEAMLPCLKEFINGLPDKPRILDLCCGAGYESMRMHKLSAQVTGLDFNERSVEIARSRNPDCDFNVRDMLEDYSDIGVFDGIAVIAGLTHIPNQKLKQAFINMARVLEPNGALLAVVFDGTGKLDRKSYVTVDGEEYDRDFYAHSLEELTEYSNGLFKFVGEILPDENQAWKNYLFRKIT